jgi:hypothetical protein
MYPTHERCPIMPHSCHFGTALVLHFIPTPSTLAGARRWMSGRGCDDRDRLAHSGERIPRQYVLIGGYIACKSFRRRGGTARKPKFKRTARGRKLVRTADQYRIVLSFACHLNKSNQRVWDLPMSRQIQPSADQTKEAGPSLPLVFRRLGNCVDERSSAKKENKEGPPRDQHLTYPLLRSQPSLTPWPILPQTRPRTYPHPR